MIAPSACPLCGDESSEIRWSSADVVVHRCRGCSLSFKAPLQDARAVADAVYGGAGISGRASHRSRLERAAREHLGALGELKPGSRLLEIGIGGGELLHEAKLRGLQPLGVELSAENAAHARSTYGVDVFLGPLAELPPETRFDVAVMSHVIEHVWDFQGLLGDVRGRLAPGGKLLVLTPNFDGALARIFGAAWSNTALADHVVLFGPRTLRVAVERAGFAVERLWTREGDTDLIGALLWRWAPSRTQHVRVRAGDTRVRTGGRALRERLRKLPYVLGAATGPLTAPGRAVLGATDLGAELRLLATAA